MVCHEVWDYDDDTGCTTLCAFRLICPERNLVTHRGMAGNIGLAERADAQLVSVNGISLDEAHDYGQAHAKWADRSSGPGPCASLPSWSSGTLAGVQLAPD